MSSSLRESDDRIQKIETEDRKSGKGKGKGKEKKCAERDFFPLTPASALSVPFQQ